MQYRELSDISKLEYSTQETAKIYEVEFIKEGLVGFPEGKSIFYLSEETILKMMKTLMGKPCFLTHQGEKKVGYVTKVEQDEKDKTFKSIVCIDDPEANEKLKEEGWGFSCQYNIKQIGSEGELNGIPFDLEVADGEFIHLAVVENPRYNNLQITCLNSLDEKNFLKEKKNFMEEIKEETLKVEGKKVLIGDEKIPLEVLIDVYKNSKVSNEAEDDLYKEEFVELDGENVPLKILIEAYLKAKGEDIKKATIVENELTTSHQKINPINNSFDEIKTAVIRSNDQNNFYDYKTLKDKILSGSKVYGDKN